MKNSSKSFFKDPQNIIAIGVTLISLCALIVSLMQTSIMQEEREMMREYSRVSVWPSLELGRSKGHNRADGSINKFVINLTNNGVGPAIITDVKATYKGKIINDWFDLFSLQGIPDSIADFITNSSFNNTILKIGDNIEILNLNDNLPLANAMYKQYDSLIFEIYYESIYKEKWKYYDGNIIKLDNPEEVPEKNQFR